MLISKLLLPVLFSLYQVLPHDNQAHDISLERSELPAIPDPTGFNGAFVGVHDGVLIFAGGANYPGKPVWAGVAKQWYDDIYVLSRDSDIPENGTPGIQGGSIEAAPAIATGRSEIVVLGGVGGPNQHLMERMAISHRAKELKDGLKTVSDATERKAIVDQIAEHQQRLTDLIKKISFSKRIISYNTETDSWRNAGILPGQSQAVNRAVYFEGGIVIPGGEVGPGVRANSIILGKISE